MLVHHAVETDALAVAEKPTREVRGEHLLWAHGVVHLPEAVAVVHRVAGQAMQFHGVVHFLVRITPQDPVARRFADRLVPGGIEAVTVADFSAIA
jgi:hypothetical protein